MKLDRLEKGMKDGNILSSADRQVTNTQDRIHSGSQNDGSPTMEMAVSPSTDGGNQSVTSSLPPGETGAQCGATGKASPSTGVSVQGDSTTVVSVRDGSTPRVSVQQEVDQVAVLDSMFASITRSFPPTQPSMIYHPLIRHIFLLMVLVYFTCFCLPLPTYGCCIEPHPICIRQPVNNLICIFHFCGVNHFVGPFNALYRCASPTDLGVVNIQSCTIAFIRVFILNITIHFKDP